MPPDTQTRPRAETMEPEIFLSSHRRIADWKLRAEELVASGKAATNTAKSLGVDLKAYKFVMKLGKMDRAEAENLIRRILLYSRWLDLGLFDQADLFAGSVGDNSSFASLTSRVVNDHKGWEAERQGYDNGKFGDPLDNNPHSVGSEFHQRYVIGWHNGNAYRQEAEARGEKIIRPKKGNANPEDHPEEGED